MGAWLDHSLLPLMVGLPLLGAFFVVLMPSTDRLTLRHVGMATTVFVGLLALRAAWQLEPAGVLWVGPLEATPLGVPQLFLDAGAVPALLCICASVPMALRAGAPRVVENTKAYVVLLLVVQAFALAALLVDSPLLAVAFLDALTYPALLCLGLLGGPHKGSTALRTGVLWVGADGLALFAAAELETLATGLDGGSLQLDAVGALPPDVQLWLVVPLLIAWGARLTVFPLSAWVLETLEQAPVGLAGVITGVVMPLSAALLSRWVVGVLDGGVEAAYPVLVGLSAAGAALGACFALIERDLRRFVAAALLVLCPVGFIALCSGGPAAVLAPRFIALCGLAAAALLFVIDAMERRFRTRDSAEFVGFARQLPGLWRLFLIAGLGLCAAPFLGPGAVLPRVLIELSRATRIVDSGLYPSWGLALVAVFAGAWLLMVSALVVHLRRALTTPVRELRAPPPLSGPQAARLWVPIVFVGIGGALAAGFSWPSSPPPSGATTAPQDDALDEDGRESANDDDDSESAPEGAR